MNKKKKAPGQSITEETKIKYLARGKQLVERFERETGKAWTQHPEELAWWLEDVKSTLMKNSFVQYKSALYYFLMENGEMNAAASIKNLTRTGCTKRSGKTSSSKRKLAPREDVVLIIEELKKSKSTHAKTLAQWLWLNLDLGMRPCERATAHEEGDILHVKNAKTTNMRGYGQTRSIDISMMTAKTDEF
ncbi:hypothetical protein [Desulfonatronum thiodismutans]|uniref:hypothetical protein n=1 Tax=Desulfonatronum thiodismutans TaxID=159290 RepID=UPI0004ABD57A|nr:hypothetical protein [Desulfonatronum thiodismutans]